MKFAALALTILLAVGSHAASLGADTPVDNVLNQLKALQALVSSIGESAATNIMSDFDDLKTKVRSEELLRNLNQSVQEIVAMKAIIAEFREQHQAETQGMREKVEALWQKLYQKISTNFEDTRTALIPFAEAVQTKVNERLQQLKEVVALYTAEFKEPLKAMQDQVESITTEDIVLLKAKIDPLVEDIKVKFQEILGHVSATVNRS